MIRALNQLEDAINAYGILQHNRDACSSIPVDDSIVQACDQLIRDSEQLYISHSKSDMAKESFRRFYRKFKLLFDKLYKHKGSQADRTILKLHESLWTSIQHFKEHMNPHEELPLYDQYLIQNHCNAVLAALYLPLQEKNVEKELLQEIQSGIDSLFDQQKAPKLCYYHCEWLDNFLQAIDRFAQDTRDKQYDIRFRELLIRYNFNYLGLRNQWKNKLEKQLQQLNNMDRLPYLLLLEKEIIHYHPLPDSNYDIEQSNLKNMMGEYIRAELEYLEKLFAIALEDKRNIPKSSSTDIHTMLTGEGLTCLFHYASKVGFFKKKQKRDAAIDVAQHFVTYRGNHITANQLSKFNKYEHSLSLYHIENKLKEMLFLIKKDIEEIELKR
jgi:hypothetical protein